MQARRYRTFGLREKQIGQRRRILLDSPHCIGVLLRLAAISLLRCGRGESLAPFIAHLQHSLVLRRIGGGGQHALQHVVQLLEPDLGVS